MKSGKLKTIKLIEVKSELGAGTRGSSLGSEALKLASLHHNSFFFGKYKSKVIEDKSHLLYKDPVRSYAKRILGILKIFDKLANAVYAEIKAGKVPVVISGDHSSAGGTIAGVKMAFPRKKLGVIWIDAHADLHSPYTTPSGNIHGMPLAVSLGIDNLDNRKNLVPENTVPYWELLKKFGGISPKINPENLVFVGLRDFEKEEASYIKQNKVKVVPVEEVRKGNFEGLAGKIMDQYLGDCDVIYISFDIDSLDARLVPGTGTPVSQGMLVKETTTLLKELLKDERLACFEITEINPLLDDANETANRIFPIFKAAAETIEKQQKTGKKAVKKFRKAAKKAVKSKKIVRRK